MNDGRELIQKYVENREQLSDEELDALVAALRLWPTLAIELKDQLIVDELLAQKCDLARWHFISQIEQRLRDESEGFVGIRTEDLAPATKGHRRRRPVRPIVTETDQRPPGSRRVFRWFASTVVAGVATVAIWVISARQVVATVEQIEGDVELVRDDHERSVAKEQAIQLGDRLITKPDSRLMLRFADGTAMNITAESEVLLPGPTEAIPGKFIRVARGKVAAEVTPQPAGKPMTFESDSATAEVVGTSLVFQVRSQQTHVAVSEGTVQVSRKADHQTVKVTRDEFAVVTAKTIATAPTRWPSDRRGLIFLFETNDQPNLVRSISTGMDRSFPLRPRGCAHLNHSYGMELTGGAFLAEDVDGEILAACRQTNELSIEATIRPTLAKQSGPARIVTFSTTVLERDFTLGQLDDQLIVRIRTPQTGPNGVKGVDTGLPICRLVAGQTHHVVVSYRPGHLVCYLDGKQVFESRLIEGDFRDWSAQHLLFGDEYAGERNWAGSLEGVAIYNRFMEPAESKRNALQYEHLRASRPLVPQTKVLARLVKKSTMPTMTRIHPNRSALVVCQYEVEKVLEGSMDSKSLTVTQWAILDDHNQPIVNTPLGTKLTLLLEPLHQNPQTKRYFVSDDEPEEPGREAYFEIRQ